MLYGHDAKVELFKNLIKKDNLSHAYLFYGDPQVGKFKFANCLASYIEYEIFDDPAKLFVDTIVLFPDSQKIGIDSVRHIRELIYRKPLQSSRRLVIIRDAERLTAEAQGALLKSVEESPEFTTFIFITYNPDVLLPPLVSRLTKVYFSRLTDEVIVDILKGKKNLSEKDRSTIAKKSFGRPGRAIDLAGGDKNYNPDLIDDYLDHHILKLYLADKKRHHSVLSWLLKRESLVKRYNLNPKLQKRAIEMKINQLKY